MRVSAAGSLIVDGSCKREAGFAAEIGTMRSFEGVGRRHRGDPCAFLLVRFAGLFASSASIDLASLVSMDWIAMPALPFSNLTGLVPW